MRHIIPFSVLKFRRRKLIHRTITRAAQNLLVELLKDVKTLLTNTGIISLGVDRHPELLVLVLRLEACLRHWFDSIHAEMR